MNITMPVWSSGYWDRLTECFYTPDRCIREYLIRLLSEARIEVLPLAARSSIIKRRFLHNGDSVSVTGWLTNSTTNVAFNKNATVRSGLVL